jgi:hypothetical protein
VKNCFDKKQYGMYVSVLLRCIENDCLLPCGKCWAHYSCSDHSVDQRCVDSDIILGNVRT